MNKVWGTGFFAVLIAATFIWSPTVVFAVPKPGDEVEPADAIDVDTSIAPAPSEAACPEASAILNDQECKACNYDWINNNGLMQCVADGSGSDSCADPASIKDDQECKKCGDDWVDLDGDGTFECQYLP